MPPHPHPSKKYRQRRSSTKAFHVYFSPCVCYIINIFLVTNRNLLQILTKQTDLFWIGLYELDALQPLFFFSLSLSAQCSHQRKNLASHQVLHFLWAWAKVNGEGPGAKLSLIYPWQPNTLGQRRTAHLAALGYVCILQGDDKSNVHPFESEQ